MEQIHLAVWGSPCRTLQPDSGMDDFSHFFQQCWDKCWKSLCWLFQSVLTHVASALKTKGFHKQDLLRVYFLEGKGFLSSHNANIVAYSRSLIFNCACITTTRAWISLQSTANKSRALSGALTSSSHPCVHRIHFGGGCLGGWQMHVCYDGRSWGIAFPQGVSRMESSRTGLCEAQGEK